MAQTLTHDNALIFLPSLSPSSAGRADRAVWRNPLSRHFSFPLTDRPWRARAFGPPAWLAARQLNKPSSCYNSLKHFQLPESNKSSRRALGRFSISNPTPQQVLLRLSPCSVWRSPRRRGRRSQDKECRKSVMEIGGYKLQVTVKERDDFKFSKLFTALLHNPPTQTIQHIYIYTVRACDGEIYNKSH